MEFLLVGVGGVLGAWTRHLLGERVETETLDTFLVNVLGSFFFGAILAAPVTEAVVLALGIGFCGAFTTFSTFTFETVRHFETGSRQWAMLNAAGHLVGAILAVLVGGWLVGLLL